MGRKRSLTMAPPPKIVDEDEDTSSESGSDDDIEDQNVSEALWTLEDQKKLIDDVAAQLPKTDRTSCFRRIKTIDWEKISIENRTSVECQDQLNKLIKKIRHVRNLNEVLCDAKVNLEKGPLSVKPQSAYTLYCKYLIQQKADMKGKNFFQEASANFKKLSDAERSVFERESTKQKELYVLEKKKVTDAKMDELTPTPFVLFCKHHMALGTSNKSVLRSQYGQLTDEDKLIWITKAVKEMKESNEHIDLSTFLNKHELKLLQGSPKMPRNAYNLFVREFCSTKDNDFKKAAEKYRNLSEKEKAKYVTAAEELKRTYQAELEVYLKSLTEEERQLRKKSNKKAPNIVDETPEAAAAASDTVTVKAKSKPKKATAASESVTSKTEQSIEKVTPTSKKALAAAKEADSGSALNGSGRKRKADSVTPVKMKVEKIAEPDKVPSSAFKYFLAREYTGKPKKARKAYSTMNAVEKKRVKHAFKTCLKEYMSQLETYLQSLTKDEMIEYADRSRQMADESDDSCSDSSSSDSSETSD